MAGNDNRATVRRFDEELFGGKLEVADEILDPEFVFYGPAAGIRGPEAFKAFVAAFRAGFPDLRLETVQVIADGDKIGRLAIMHGTHSGEFRGIPAGGAQLNAPRIDGFRFADGRITEVQAHFDHTAFFAALRQEEAVPA